MLNFKDLGDMTKLAGQAQQLQRAQQDAEESKMRLLNKISSQLDEILKELRTKG